MAFPTTPILDSFTNVDGMLLPTHNSKWVKSSDSTLIDGIIASNQATSETVDDSPDYFWDDIFGPDAEAYLTVKTKVDGRYIECGARCTTKVITTFSGYLLSINFVAGPDNDRWDIYREDSGSFVLIAGPVFREVNNGDVVGIETKGAQITGYLNGESVISTMDSTYSAAGFIYTACGPLVVFDTWGGGTTVGVADTTRHLLSMRVPRLAYG